MKIAVKKLSLFFMVVIMTLSFAACSGGNGSDSGTSSGTADDQQSTSAGEESNSSSGSNGSTGSNGTAPSDGAPSNPSGTPSGSADKGTKILVAYFSATGTTKTLAEYAADALHADIYEIVPDVPYTAEDLKYYTDCRADKEQNDPSCRPAINGGVSDMAKYDVVFIGYPIWHGEAPKIMYTFLESYDLSGKTIVPFCTSGSSPIGSSAKNLHGSADQAVWKDGVRFAAGTSENEIKNWIKGLNFDLITETEETIMYAYCNDNKLKIELADNASAKAFEEKLKSGDITVTMDDYGDFEKVGSLGFSIVQSNTNITTKPGDVILYQGNNITMYYDQNSWNFTLLGRIAGQTRESMLDFFGGKGEVTVRFSLK